MGSVATIENQNGVNATDITYENITLCRVKVGEKTVDGEVQSLFEVKPEADAKKLAEEGKGEIVFTQTFRNPSPRSIEGVRQLIPSEEEQVNLIAKNLAVKLRNRAYAFMNQTDEDGTYNFEPVEVYDMTEEAGRVSGRRASNPLDKALKAISASGLDEEQLKALVSLLQMKQA